MRPFLLLPLLAAACSTLPSASELVTGKWGGTHVGLDLGPNGGTLEYDCAAGTMSGPLLVGADGTFTAQGTHTPGVGGPEIAGQPRASHPVRYTGRISGSSMSLQGRVANGVTLGPFTLRKDAEPIIFRCL